MFSLVAKICENLMAVVKKITFNQLNDNGLANGELFSYRGK